MKDVISKEEVRGEIEMVGKMPLSDGLLDDGEKIGR